MAWFKACLAAALLPCLVSADVIKVTATSSNTFDPATVTAKQGDVVEFHFEPRNHSVVSGDYNYPCSPVQLGKGFFSGFMPVESGQGAKVFRVNVSNTDPTAFYSSQGDECPKGMVGIINPSGDRNLDNYKNKAAALSRAVSPGGTAFGGDVVDSSQGGQNSKPSQGGGSQGGQGGQGAAGALGVPVVGLVAALGMAVLMA